MLYLTCTTITSVGLAHYGVSRAKDWVSVDCGTNTYIGSALFYQKPRQRNRGLAMKCLDTEFCHSICSGMSPRELPSRCWSRKERCRGGRT